MSVVGPEYLTTSKRREKLFSCQTIDSKYCEVYDRSSVRLRHFDLKIYSKSQLSCSSIISKYGLDKYITKKIFILCPNSRRRLSEFCIFIFTCLFWLAFN